MVKINWRVIVWVGVFWYIVWTAPYWAERWAHYQKVCNPQIVSSCEP